MEICISTLVSQSAQLKLDHGFFIDCMLKLENHAFKENIIKRHKSQGITLVELAGSLNKDSKYSDLIGNNLVKRDLNKRLGDYAIFATNQSGLEAESKRDFIIPKEEVIQRWVYYIKLNLQIVI